MKHRPNHRQLFLICLTVALIPACSSERDQATSVAKTAASADGTIHLSADQVRASGIRSAEVVERDVAPTIVALARVKARAGGMAEVFSPFPGRLVGGSPPKIGDSVRQGQRIAEVEQQFAAGDQVQMSTTAIQAHTMFEQAQQELAQKQAELNRAQQLYDGGAIPQKQLQVAQFDVAQAETRLEGARRAMQQYDAAISTSNSSTRRRAIVAPISGTVVASTGTLGQQIDPSKNLLTIADLRTVWVEAAVHEQDLSRIGAARTAEIVIPGSTAATLTGTLITIGSLIDSQNRTAPVIFSVDNRASALRIDMFVEAHIPTGSSSKVLIVPASAVLAEGTAPAVYIETQPGVYVRKAVGLGDRSGDTVVVSSGLKKGDKIVTVGAGALRSESMKSEIPAEADDKGGKDEKD
ncbi:MAG TPA: efflux RND transporter periplasmic adaptor subunit [Vicinamibacterales bacterium]|jgi:cobalt-zinc-cadmium efflux system membrane fusion protein|nr:efflux RND transporter periplasmic adaptor subunit [Vicinamibacterales bacterium]